MTQKIVNGIAQLPTILKEVGCEKLFLVVDSSYPFLNIKDAIEALPVKERVMFSDFTPKFAKKFADCGKLVKEGVGEYIKEVESGAFPAEEHNFKIDQQVVDAVK